MNDNLDNIGRIQQKLQPTIVLFAADILQLKDTINELYSLTKGIGEAVCVNSEALKKIVEVLSTNDSGKIPELDLTERFDVWCDVVKHLQQAFTKHQESIRIDLDTQRNRWDTQRRLNENLQIEIDACKTREEAYVLQHKELVVVMTELVVAMQNK